MQSIFYFEACMSIRTINGCKCARPENRSRALPLEAYWAIVLFLLNVIKYVSERVYRLYRRSFSLFVYDVHVLRCTGSVFQGEFQNYILEIVCQILFGLHKLIWLPFPCSMIVPIVSDTHMSRTSTLPGCWSEWGRERPRDCIVHPRTPTAMIFTANSCISDWCRQCSTFLFTTLRRWLNSFILYIYNEHMSQ